ncbi:hypothetical protein [Tropicimonas sp. IMCC34011]|nr:hypothetical protein [Tropicimonas sp. IMCC34011]
MAELQAGIAVLSPTEIDTEGTSMIAKMILASGMITGMMASVVFAIV